MAFPWALGLLGLATAVTAAESPVTVSPGGASTAALIDDACPTFSWGAVDDAEHYELVVYRVGDEGEDPRPVLRQTFAGSASSWTPSLDRCLERGGSYAWSLRAMAEETASDWSRPNLFRVAAGPSAVELEAALAVVRAYLGARGEALPERAAEDATESPTEANGASTEDPPALAPPGTQLSIDGNVDAVSFSGSGALLTSLDPASLAAGTAAIDISGNAATATDATSAGSASDLACTACVGATEIDETGLDADLLDGLDSADLAPASHDHLDEVWFGNTGNGLKVDFFTNDQFKAALWGRMTAATAGLFSAAVRGENLALASGTGVWGSDAGNGIGILGTTEAGVGVFGAASGTTGVNYGVYGQTASPSGFAGYFTGKTHIDGPLGIGTTSPAWPLSILGSQAVAQLETSSSLNGSVLELKSSVLNATHLGAINFNNFANSFPGQIAYQGDDVMTFRTAGAERMRVTDVGRVGINTTSPQADLHVNGSIAIAATQRWLSIAATAFDFHINAINVNHSIQRHPAYFGLRDYGISNTLFINQAPAYAAVSLPDGATIRELKSKDTLSLQRVNIDTEAVEVIAQLTSGGTGTTTAITAGTEVVDNSTYAYVLGATAISTVPGDLGAVRIRYEITSPLP